MNFSKKFWMPHLCSLICLIVLTVIYFKPVVLENKALPQGDMISAIGMAKEVAEFKEETGEYSGWTNSMFGGMPTISFVSYPAFNVFGSASHVATLGFDYQTAGIIILALLAAYISLVCLGFPWFLSLLGSIAIGFVSYNFIIIEAGHVTKGYAIGCMIIAISGMLICFKGKTWAGALLTLVGTGLLAAANHVQIAYYTLLVMLVIWVVYAVFAFKKREIMAFVKRSAVLAAIAVLALLPSSVNLFPMLEYSKDTMRGGQVLEQKESIKKESSGLDIDYAYSWSYGKAETLTLLIPYAYGGSSHETISSSSPLVQRYGLSRAPTYWGEQPFTSGPVYAGAIICFLFVLGLFVVKGPERWWITIALLLALVLAWGQNLILINEFFFHHLPLYNKFRTPAMALVTVNLLMPLMGLLALKVIFDEAKPLEKYKKPILYSGAITGGICLILALFGSSLMSFSSSADANLQWPADALESLRNTRIGMLKADAWRSLLLIAIGVCVLWCYISGKFKASVTAVILSVIVLLDLWTVDKRYLNDNNFQSKQNVTVYPSDIDMTINSDPDPNFRVFNAASNTFNESTTSYFHKSVGGYSPAKLRRYQDIIDYHFSKGLNFRVLNMLNTKYFIVPEQSGGGVQRNEGALGNAWFVDSLMWVNSNNEEIEALYNFNPQKTAVIHSEFTDQIPLTLAPLHKGIEALSYSSAKQEQTPILNDTTSLSTSTGANITLTEYKPNHLSYESHSDKDRIAVFSEIYYPKEWKAYIDGKEVPHWRCNYILRSLIVPSGNHKIEFKHSSFHRALWTNTATYSSLAVCLLLLASGGFYIYNRNKKQGKTLTK